MAKSLTKDEILHDIIRTLISGWGKGAVYSALEEVSNDVAGSGKRKRGGQEGSEVDPPEAVKLVEELRPHPNQDLLLQFAQEFDRGEALPKMSDIRRFLVTHHVRPESVKSRNQAFRKILPVMADMSEKGLLRIIRRSRFSGPAQLDEISDAIRGAGENMRGAQHS